MIIWCHFSEIKNIEIIRSISLKINKMKTKPNWVKEKLRNEMNLFISLN